REDQQRPVVLLSGGVGLTPMISMLEEVAKSNDKRSVHYVHGAIDGSVHAMGGQVRKLAAERQNLEAAIFYQTPRENDERGVHYDHGGLIPVDWLAKNTPIEDADFYLCGPKPFLATFVNGLAQAGVAHDRIHYEFFGPADGL